MWLQKQKYILHFWVFLKSLFQFLYQVVSCLMKKAAPYKAAFLLTWSTWLLKPWILPWDVIWEVSHPPLLLWRSKVLGLHFTLSCNFTDPLITTRTKKSFHQDQWEFTNSQIMSRRLITCDSHTVKATFSELWVLVLKINLLCVQGHLFVSCTLTCVAAVYKEFMRSFFLGYRD